MESIRSELGAASVPPGVQLKYGFVFTNFNNAKITEKAVASLYSSEIGEEYAVVVVDNKSEDEDLGLLNEIQLKHPRLKIIYNAENIGYFRGLNVGIKYLRETYAAPACIVVGNNDLEFDEKFRLQLEHCRDVISEHAVIAPGIINIDGYHQNPQVISKTSISLLRKMAWNLFYSSYLAAYVINYLARVLRLRSLQRIENPEDYSTPRFIHQGYGACYILGPKFFESFRELWAPGFMMHEEKFLSMQLEERGLQCYYEPGISVYHRGHATIDKVPKKRIWELCRNSYRIIKDENHRKKRRL